MKISNKKLRLINELYFDPKFCTQSQNLKYINNTQKGYKRLKWGKGFCYKNWHNQTIKSTQLKNRFEQLAIPPQWDNVWICKYTNGHLQATGFDQANRKQYIYHPQWNKSREILNFYRLIPFAYSLNQIRPQIKKDFQNDQLNRQKIIAGLLLLLEATHMRIGNPIYFADNETIGLTTLLNYNIKINQQVLQFKYKAKSNQKRSFSITNNKLANFIQELKACGNKFIFSYRDSNQQIIQITPELVNQYLNQISPYHITAKDFRTWAGTYYAFQKLEQQKDLKEAISYAADHLGNTTNTAKKHYIDSNLVECYQNNEFQTYLKRAKQQKFILPNLTKQENLLLQFLSFSYHQNFTQHFHNL